MDVGGFDELAAAAPRFDALVDETSDLDVFCSSTDWIIPAQRAFGGANAQVRFAQTEEAALALAGHRVRNGARLLTGLDPVWGYARPVVGPNAIAATGLLLDALAAFGGTWDALLLTGLRPSSRFAQLAEAALTERFTVEHRPGMVSQVVHLGPDGGIDTFLARRSAHFRKNLRQAQRRASARGVALDYVRGGGGEVIERAVGVERRTWKGLRHSGLSDTTFAGFYREMAGRLASSGRLRAGFAQAGEVDVGYILGAVRGANYRGLQLGYDADWATCSLGNLLQLGQMTDLIEEAVTRYDLGMDMAYKRSWADEAVPTESLLVIR